MANRHAKVEAISEDNYLKLVGLLKLAEDDRKSLERIEQAVVSITGETIGDGLGGEAVWSDDLDAAMLLDRLDITVLPAAELPQPEKETKGV